MAITMEDVNDNLNLPWVWYAFSSNPNINIQFITEHIDERWDWFELSSKLGNDIETN